MKFHVRCIILSTCAFTFIAGCGKQPAKRGETAGDQLTASELAQMMDFHAWKILVPSSQQPFKQVRLVIVKSDGAAIPKFQTSIYSAGIACSSILLGFRTEQSVFAGHLYLRDSQGGGQGWDVNFTDSFADSFPAWTIGEVSPEWKDNRVRLAVTTRNGDTMPEALEMELVK
jgi:hypothetical protein